MRIMGIVFLIAGFLFLRLGKNAGRVVRILGFVLVFQGLLFFFLPLLIGSNP
jgi:hypothetical protein